jgi:hypothetical protein
VVTDGGTSQQKTNTFSPTEDDAFRTDLTLHDINPANPDLPGFIVIPRMAPLSPGHHTYEIIWVQSARTATEPAPRKKAASPLASMPRVCDRLTSRSQSLR